MYKSIHFWNQKNQMNPMVAADFCKIMRFSRKFISNHGNHQVFLGQHNKNLVLLKNGSH